MSIEAMVWAREQYGLPPHEKLLLLQLADGYHPGNSPPDLPLPDEEWVIRHTGLTKREYYEALKELRQKELVTVDDEGVSFRLSIGVYVEY